MWKLPSQKKKTSSFISNKKLSYFPIKEIKKNMMISQLCLYSIWILQTISLDSYRNLGTPGFDSHYVLNPTNFISNRMLHLVIAYFILLIIIHLGSVYPKSWFALQSKHLNCMFNISKLYLKKKKSHVSFLIFFFCTNLILRLCIS